ncbi:surface antigen [Thermosporothrix hazakensis]|uniref:Surface antigen n=2 Tax=Thermosporothrix TaxID=768650 RepID=A0A326U124_THEHA|nr:LysM peptidoglycan-binding domain-containing protein [Thermosporothrix hazakensis]PZW24224.1 surface antigen [Thermosporothrix hazakensis]BBH89669.1 hypothetical protein KTC_44200 [Thermosporothrix sp. COM3]GCE47855.1 hypothetical protein KTH_27240 [Thermosporothrix hazakensis]
MNRLQTIWQYCKKRSVAKLAITNLAIIGALLIGAFGVFGDQIASTFAAGLCSTGDQTYVVRPGDTLGAIAMQYGTNYQNLATYNKLPNPDLIYVDQHVCIPGKQSGSVSNNGGGSSQGTTPSNVSTISYTANRTHGSGNYFPYGQCTWWANERFHQLHGYYVPWTTNSNAWQWVDRAREFGWNVSYTPVRGAVVVLQANVQGASWLGHVGIVESINADGSVTVSNMNWGANPWSVSYSTIYPGSGVAFVY